MPVDPPAPAPGRKPVRSAPPLRPAAEAERTSGPVERTGGPPVRRVVPEFAGHGAGRDPYPYYRLLRERFPLVYDRSRAAWLLSRYADVATALTDSRFTGVQRPGDPACAAHFAPVAPDLPDVVQRTAYVLARRIAGRETADLVAEFCRWLPIGALATAVGVPYRDMPRLLRGREAHAGPAGPCAARTAVREKALASFLASVLGDPDLSATLRGTPGGSVPAGLIGRAWAESLRHDPPVPLVLRHTVADVRLSGGTVPAGARVACLIGAAGRDPDRFPDPDRFDPGRAAPGQLTFGDGFCPAVLLAGLEAEHGLRALLDVMPGLRLADGFRPVRAGLTVRSPRTLLVSPGGGPAVSADG
ncbi:cytochrome P450 [Streptomyces sp. NPDC088725]|uniref:cytochrome P450 n=1 Tax=Streptomyces sp. NPDC088725 TaxID=3365873 RepID=UPI003819A056